MTSPNWPVPGLSGTSSTGPIWRIMYAVFTSWQLSALADLEPGAPGSRAKQNDTKITQNESACGKAARNMASCQSDGWVWTVNVNFLRVPPRVRERKLHLRATGVCLWSPHRQGLSALLSPRDSPSSSLTVPQLGYLIGMSNGNAFFKSVGFYC